MLIEIPWEKRALQIASYQVVMDDSFDIRHLQCEIEQKRKEHNGIFAQVFVNKESHNFIPELSNLGFFVVETRLTAGLNFRKSELLKAFCNNNRMFFSDDSCYKNIRVTKQNTCECQYREQLKNIAVHSFIDDRFHLDVNCSRAIANQRFSLWVDDLLDDRECDLYSLHDDANTIGFAVIKGNQVILICINPKYQHQGFGKFFWLSIAQDRYSQGDKTIQAVISANNVVVINLHASLKFKFRNPIMVMHYWDIY